MVMQTGYIYIYIYREWKLTKYVVQPLNSLKSLGLDYFLSSVYWDFTPQ